MEFNDFLRDLNLSKEEPILNIIIKKLLNFIFIQLLLFSFLVKLN
jgi:hypothetical protein